MGINADPALIIVRLPVMALKFWLLEGPAKIAAFLWIIVGATANVLSIQVLIKTFFAPWKGEYRKGFVTIARSIGIIIRFFTLSTGLFIILIVLGLGSLLIVGWIVAPIVWTLLLLANLGIRL
jgi:hypothetical protein